MGKSSSYRVLGIGSGFIDQIIPVSETFLKQITGERGGSFQIDANEFSMIVEMAQVKPVIKSGGSAANVLKCLARLGESCTLFTSLGEDDHGRHFIQCMKQANVKLHLLRSDEPTSTVLCLVTPDGQRTMAFIPGSSRNMTPESLEFSYFEGMDLVHLEAHQLRHSGVVEAAITKGKNASAKLSIDLSSFEIAHEFGGTIRELLNKSFDIVFANEDEAKALTGRSAEQACLELQKMAPIAVIMIGKKGCLIGHQGEILHCPGLPVKVVDTIGGGDYFVGGFLHGWLQGLPLKSCGALGNQMGAAIVSVQGAELPPRHK